MLEKIFNWYQSILPEKWKNKSGIAVLIVLWIAIAIFEIFWLISGVTDLPTLVGTPAFFAILTFVIGKWGLKIW